MLDLDLTSLRFFVAVCNAGNIARAAEQSHVVSSAVSKRLVQLETRLGTRLFFRRRHGVELTSAGETLLEHARAMLSRAQRIERDMAAYAAGVRGQVRVLATVSVMSESLADDVAKFLDKPEHAGIRVDIEERVSTTVVQGVREGVASVGICWDAADLQGLQSRAYRHDQLAVVVPPEHPLAQRTGVSFVESLNWEHVGLPLNSAVVALMMRTAAEHGRNLNFRMIVTNFEAAIRVVRARLAISVVPLEAVITNVHAYDLRLIPLTDPWAKRRFAICFRNLNTLTAASRTLVDYLGSDPAS
ncbi:MAG: LysR family transcriptional regulator [Burkholderiales bacterium]|mgnify:CR=1 FL=1|nr:LysR family transcriptional regulator [Burkholderiales bacterium]MBS0403081.1 LysR family transcriptional regulator [Pseudomonadota bacterium]MBS0414896.1 LysR family transcriptional regulator [Pseudomonadota bacterium]